MATALHWMRRKIRRLAEEKPDLQHALPILDLPVSTAFALSMLVVPAIYEQAPRLIHAIMGAVTLIPAAVILRRLLETSFVSNPQCDRHHVFRWSIPYPRRFSTGVGQVYISRPSAGRDCLSCLGASELAPTAGSR